MSMLLGTVSGEVSEKLCLGETLTDALYQLLLTLNAKATAPDLILRPVVEFITPGVYVNGGNITIRCMLQRKMIKEMSMKRFVSPLSFILLQVGGGVPPLCRNQLFVSSLGCSTVLRYLRSLLHLGA